MRQHELRTQVVKEMHLRRWEMLCVPCLYMQWVVLLEPDEREAEYTAIEKRLGALNNGGNTTHRSGRLSERVAFTWERHSEGTTISLFVDRGTADEFLHLKEHAELAAAIDWVESLPGAVLRATRAIVVDKEKEAETIVARTGFESHELVSCHIGKSARIWSDFRVKPDGFGAIIIASSGTKPSDLTRLIQRLQELGNYRNRALLGLPIAQKIWPSLNQTESDLTDIAHRIAEGRDTDDQLMREISELSVNLNAGITEASFRMSATAAYGSLVDERLKELESRRIEGYASLNYFTQRRFAPAVRFCSAVTKRQGELAERAGQLATLLRARIETRIENQNGRLLRSMDRNAAMQLRLQRLVEGLSIVAASYYALGVISYVLGGLSKLVPAIDKDLVLAILVIPVVIGIYAFVQAAKKRLLDNSE
ncbi:MAG: DUF3422 domain-containing protein [Pseudomonadota bacterium]